MSACADKSAIREKERERYDALESDLISAQEAEERRRRSEFRIAQKLKQLDSERTSIAMARKSTPSQALMLNEDKSNPLDPTAVPVALSKTEPVVTQIVVGQSAADGAETWSLQNYPSPVDGTALCAVVSAPVVVTNGTLETRVSVIIGKNTVFLRTDASFDTTVPEIGYRIDMGIPIAFDHFLNELTAVVDDGYERLMSAMSGGSSLRVSFAYLPQLSSAETHVVEFSLDSIDASLTDLIKCGQETQNTEKSEAG